MKSMTAVARALKAPFTFEYVELPEPTDNEVLVKVAAVGLCHTDISSKNGTLPSPFPAIFGHEGAGVVERVGKAVTKVAPGDHVVLAPSYCGTCVPCMTGEPMYCSNFMAENFCTDPNGRKAIGSDGKPIFVKYFGQSSFGQYALSNAQNTIKVRKDVPLNILGPLGCGIQTGAGTVMNGMKPRPGSSIAIFGSGSVGLSALMGAVVCGCTTIIAIDVLDSRLEMARTLGATHTINSKKDPDAAAAIRAILPQGVNYIVDTTAIPGLLRQVCTALAIRGTVGLVGAPSPEMNFEINFLQALLQGFVVQGFVEGHCVPEIFIPQMIELYKQGKFPFDKMITLYPFEKINEAIADQHDGKVIKIVLDLAGSTK